MPWFTHPPWEGSISRHPDVETITGSTTRLFTPYLITALATSCARGTEGTMPVLRLSVPMSSSTASSCARSISGLVSATFDTPLVFCAVRPVMAVVENTLNASQVFMSAWMPAPPPESDPAMPSHAMRR